MIKKQTKKQKIIEIATYENKTVIWVILVSIAIMAYTTLLSLYLFENTQIDNINMYECDETLIGGEDFVMCLDNTTFHELKYSDTNMWLEYNKKRDNLLSSFLIKLTLLIGLSAIILLTTTTLLLYKKMKGNSK